jgi:hypothetical protein
LRVTVGERGLERVHEGPCKGVEYGAAAMLSSVISTAVSAASATGAAANQPPTNAQTAIRMSQLSIVTAHTAAYLRAAPCSIHLRTLDWKIASRMIRMTAVLDGRDGERCHISRGMDTTCVS